MTGFTWATPVTPPNVNRPNTPTKPAIASYGDRRRGHGGQKRPLQTRSVRGERGTATRQQGDYTGGRGRGQNQPPPRLTGRCRREGGNWPAWGAGPQNFAMLTARTREPSERKASPGLAALPAPRRAHTRSLRCTPETDATSHTKRTSIKKNTSDGSKLKTYRHGQIPTPTA